MDSSPKKTERDAAYDCLAGGGEMGERMRRLDWSATPLGPVAAWPQSLRTAVSVVLASGFPMAIFWGPEYVQLYNNAYRPVLGATKHPQALGQRGCDCWSEIWDMIGPMFDRVMAQGKAIWSEDLLFILERNRYTEETYFTFSYSPIRDETGGVGGVLCTCVETTQRVLSERRLRLLRELAARSGAAKTTEEACRVAAETLANYAGDLPFALIYLLDAASAQAQLIGTVGLPPETPASPRVIELAKTARPAGVWPLLKVARTGRAALVDKLTEQFGALPGRPWPEAPSSALVLPVASSNQERLAGFLVAGLSPRRALDDDYYGFCELVAGHIASVVANARAYEEERTRAEALAELDRAKTVFFSNVSHEFRTPLTLLLGPLEDALAEAQTSLTAPQRERLDLAHRNALRLLKLVNTLLDFSRIEAGRIQAVYEPVDLASYTAELASVFRSAIERAGLRLTVNCPPLSEPVYVDREMWEKIVFNLLSNALKFTFAGEIAVTLTCREQQVELEVRDTGVGIPAEELPNIFKRFHRVRGTQARTHEGSGIGLALVQELARLHGGTVQVNSTLGAGTAFTVTIPTGQAHLPADRIGGARTLESTALGATPYVEEALRWLPDSDVGLPILDFGLTISTTPSAEHQQSKLPRSKIQNPKSKILLVDDNADMREYVRRLLAQHYQVEAVADGLAALQAARARVPDLVLADVMMPGLDGFELLRELRAEARTRAMPVILLSARAGEESRVEGLEAGADDYLIKPFSARELLARVATHLELTQLRRQAEEMLRTANRRKDEFLAMLAHELRNPLAPIRSAVQVLRRLGPPEPELRHANDVIERQVQHLVRLVDDLLDTSRITQGKITLQKEELELMSVIGRALETSRPLIEARNHQLSLALPPEPILLEGDLVRLAQVISNLLNNAAKYTEEGGQITLAVEPAGAELVVRVRDNGIGLPADLLPHIFDLFTQAERSLDRAQGGLGIGLALVRNLVELHGGRVEVFSDGPGCGSEFVVRLPVLKPTTRKTEMVSTATDGHAAASALSYRILLVEDNRDSAESMALWLSFGGHEVRMASDGPMALRLAQSFQPQVILLDIGLPGMDGYQVAQHLRGQPEMSQAVLIALTGYGQAEDLRRSKEAGFDHHLIKPVDPARLEGLLAQLACSLHL